MSTDDIYYRLSFADRVLEHLPMLEARAAAAGRGDEYRRALDTIYAWLRSDPASLGEPTRDYPRLRQTEYTAVHGPLNITYTIHWDERIVFIAKYLRIVRWAGF
jgi:hypothetical protein